MKVREAIGGDFSETAICIKRQLVAGSGSGLRGSGGGVCRRAAGRRPRREIG